MPWSAPSHRTGSGRSRPCPEIPDGSRALSARPPLDSPEAERAWQDFLEALVKRYGPNGSYWTHEYQQQYPDAIPMPIEAWQVWNEPNLSKYFAPKPSAPEYAHLVDISGKAIKSQDPKALIVLAGMPGNGDVNAWTFLDELYGQPGFAGNFDVAALHPYGRNIGEVATQIQKVRAAMDRERRARHAPVDHGARLGVGKAGQVRPQQGTGWPGAPADRLVQADPEPPQGLERATTVLVRLARPAAAPRRASAASAPAPDC